MQNDTKISGFPLSPQQKRIYSLQQRGTTCWTQGAILIEGELNPAILKTAIQQVVDNHDLLRTSFRRLPGMKLPLMVANDSSLVTLELFQSSADYETLFQTRRRQQINLEQDCLLNCSLAELSPKKFILHLCLPALCADPWTIQTLASQIIQSYKACLENRQISPSTVQYWQFSQWHNQLLEEEEAEEGKTFWQQQMPFSPVTLLPFETQSLDPSSFESDCFSLDIEPELISKMEALSGQYNITVDLILLSIWQVLIWRLTGQSESVITVSSDRRDSEELHDLLGLVATELPLKIQLTSEVCFQELLERVKTVRYEQSQWQDYFVAQPIDNNNGSVFPLGFEFLTLPESCTVGEVTFSMIAQESYLEPFNIKLVCLQSDNQLKLTFYYNINAFSKPEIQKLAKSVKLLLNNALINPKISISKLQILSEEERQQLLVEFNPLAKNFSQEKCLHHLFEEQAALNPDQIAVVFEEEQLTYSSLNAKANQLAHYLQKLGIGTESVVGIVKTRSLEMIVAMLGILKAGGAYLPLDPALPAQGLNFRLQDAKVRHLISDSSFALSLDQTTIIKLDQDWETIALESQENPTSNVTPENLIYVLYTSGSTGQPKGVAVEHRQLFNYLHGILDRLELSQPASFATVSTFAADLGNTAIFPALCRGGCLHIISQERAMNPDALAQYCDRHPIDCLKIVPSHLNALLSTTDPAKIWPKQYLILGGEALNWQLVAKIQSIAPNCKILNHYGPTETTVGVLTYRVKGEGINPNTQTVPLGRPLPHVRVYVLDPQQQLVPVGVAGELYIGGDSVTRGYLNNPQLTAERFITHLFDGEKLYQTGDRVRYLPDGNLEFLGRIDHQVKLRGFRLELEEIEALLNQHEGVRQSVTSVWEKEPGQQQLVAYIVANKGQGITANTLRSFLREKLPEYAIPSAFFFLKNMPLTPNGKINRQSLPAPDSLSTESATTFVAPRNEIEQKLADIWQDLLKVEKVSINDNFFDIGGHSLLMVQIHSQLRELWQQEIAITDLFKYPTISALAQFLSQGTSETDSLKPIYERAESRRLAREQRSQFRQKSQVTK